MTGAGARELEELLLGAPLLEFTAVGEPGPQGSKTAYPRRKNGKVVGTVVKESSPLVKPWREAVAKAALAAAGPDWVTLDGPVVLGAVFSMPRPKSEPKTLRTVPDRKPDLSKLVRSTEDALATNTKILAEDSRIVAYQWLRKVYEGDVYDPDALACPGAVIRLWRYPPHLLGKLETINPQIRTKVLPSPGQAIGEPC